MNFHHLLLEREAAGKPVRVGVIGAGKFASMFLAQARRTPGLHLLALCDLDLERARSALRGTGWEDARFGAASFDDALRHGTTRLTDDPLELIAASGMEVVVDATGVPAAGIRHTLACCEAGRDIVMVNVEADVLAGPLLAQRAQAAGIVYSMAYGDQPALITELVDWARAAGFEVVCAGKGTKYLPEYHASTPETVWDHYGLTAAQAATAGMNSKMFNSFLDGTKSAIEMAAVANATGLLPPRGLSFPPCGTNRLARILRPHADGGVLARKGTVEVVSSLERNGSLVPNDLRWGVYVTFEAPSDYVRNCFAEYGLPTDESGRYAALFRPYHLIGLELGISIASVALRREPTGSVREFRGDVVATAKRDLEPGEMLDGEGGYTVWGNLLPAEESVELGGLPIGLAHGVRLERPVRAGEPVRWQDVAQMEESEPVRIRREMEARFRAAGPVFVSA